MKTEDWQKVNDIVLDALDLETARRPEFVKNRCGGNSEIQREVESLLANETAAEAADFFGSSAVINYASFFDQEEAAEALAGQQIGNYRIIREIGRGGMGAVYLAERADGSFEQQVALKLLKRELNTTNLRRRFSHERQILAALQHPHIARLLDAGTSSDSIPFLAMEYVEGLPIDVFCDKHNYDIKQRLKLFRAVCEAVAFAHRNLIVHRDLKPSNILVTADGVPKLLDFGIAKLLTPEFEAASEHTITQLGAMTPSYASPEQLKMENVLTTSDVYSLGVVLYELLAGHRPFESLEGNLQKVIKAVCKTEPPPPSSVVSPISTAGNSFNDETTALKTDQDSSSLKQNANVENKTTANRFRHTNPQFASLNPHQLRGDLDNIVLKALKKDPDRRYSTVEFFSEDIRRHLDGLPVSARPDTFFYRAEKFVKRNILTVGAAALIVLAIIVGAAATLWQAQIARAESVRAKQQAIKAEKINTYLQNVLNFSNPHWLSSNPERNRNATVAQAMDEAAVNLENELAAEPEIQAEIQFTLGKTYTSQGQLDKAEKQLRGAIERFGQASETDNPKAMQATVILADVLYLKAQYDEAEELYKQAIAYFEPKLNEDESHRKWLAIALCDLGNVHLGKGKNPEAVAAYQESYRHALKLIGRDRYVVPITLGNLGNVSGNAGDLTAALNFYNQALEELRRLSSGRRFEEGTTRLLIGRTFSELGDYRQAEENFQQAYDIFVSTVGEENMYISLSMFRTANVYYLQGDYERSKKLIDKTLVMQKKLFPNGHLFVKYSEGVLGKIYTKTGELEKGESVLRDVLQFETKIFKEPHPDIAFVKAALGENLIAQKRFEEARELLTAAQDGFRRTRGENYPSTRKCGELLAQIDSEN